MMKILMSMMCMSIFASDTENRVISIRPIMQDAKDQYAASYIIATTDTDEAKPEDAVVYKIPFENQKLNPMNLVNLIITVWRNVLTDDDHANHPQKNALMKIYKTATQKLSDKILAEQFKSINDGLNQTDKIDTDIANIIKHELYKSINTFKIKTNRFVPENIATDDDIAEATHNTAEDTDDKHTETNDISDDTDNNISEDDSNADENE